MVEHSAVNRSVVSSSLSGAAIRRNREGGSFFVAAPDDWGEMTFGEVCSGESRARRTLRRSRKPCQGQP